MVENVTQLVGYLSSLHDVLGSIPSTILVGVRWGSRNTPVMPVLPSELEANLGNMGSYIIIFKHLGI